MSEYAIPISNLNDFIFCPASIYFHSLDLETDRMTYQSEDQLNGTAAHAKVDAAAYSTSACVLQGIGVYSERYDLYGKIDTFDENKGLLRERKKRIKTVYDGYVFQLYGQYFALCEMGYKVNKIELYSMDDNRIFPVLLPEENTEMFSKFETVIREMKEFCLDSFSQTNGTKCARCIYEPLCSFSCSKEDI